MKFFAAAWMICGIAGAATWTRIATHTLPQNTHRPEILALPDGGLVVAWSKAADAGDHQAPQVQIEELGPG